MKRAGGSSPASVARLVRQKRTLAQLARSEHLTSGDLPAFLREMARTVADVLEVERVGVWLFDEARTAIRCELLWERTTRQLSAGRELAAASNPAYFAALDEEGVIDAHDARNDPRTAEFAAPYLEPLGITSMLDAPIRLDGRMVGVLCHEQVGPARVWRPDEQQLAGSISDLIGLALAVAERCRAIDSLRESEERYRHLVENVGDVIYSLSPDGYVTSLNGAFERILGWQRDEWIGAHFSLLLHPDDLPLAWELQRRVLAGEAPPAFEMRIRDSTGVFRVGEFRATPERRGGRVVGITGVGRDVTERKRLEMGAAELYRIKQEEARTEAALARIGREMMSSLDAPVLLEKLCHASREALECDLCHTFLYGPAADEFVLSAGVGDTPFPWEALRAICIPRSSFADLVAKLETEGLVRVSGGMDPALDGLMAAYGVGAGLLVAIRRDDTLAGVLSVGRRDAANPFGAVEERIVRQIAHVASLALANAELLEKLEGAGRLKSQFVATMSHELRTPLHVILGYTELLLEGAFGHLALAQIETLQRIGRSAESLCELVNATLDLSRLEAGKMAIDRREVDIEPLVLEVTRRVLDGAGRPAVELVCDIEPDLDAIETDPGKLKIVLANLLGNAFKFTEAGRVMLRVCRLEDGLELTVSDTGVGIPREAQELIFEPFRQGDSTMARRHGGVGLGLHIVRQLLGVLGGAISVESEPARGATFRVWLPARGSADHAVRA